MTIVGCDFHPGWQQVAVFDSETGEIREVKLENGKQNRRFSRPASLRLSTGVHETGIRHLWSSNPTAASASKSSDL